MTRSGDGEGARQRSGEAGGRGWSGAVAETRSSLADALDAVARAEGMTAAVCAMRVDGAPIVALRPDEPYYPASTIKVPIMVEVFRQAHAGRLSLADEAVLTPEDQVTGSGVLQHLSAGIRLPLRDLVTLMIIVSDNTATNMLIDRVGADAVNATMTALGLRGTVLYNKLQVVPVERRGVNVTTAGDLCLLLGRIGRGEAVSYDASRRMVEILLRQTLVGGLGRDLPTEARGRAIGAPAPVRVASKSGTIDGIRHDVGLVLLPERSYAVSVLLRDVDHADHGTDVISRLSRMVFDAVVGET